MGDQPLLFTDIHKLVDMLLPPIGGGMGRRLTTMSYELTQLLRRHGCQPFIKLLVPPEQYRNLLDDVRTRQPTIDYEVRPGLLCFEALGIGFEVEAMDYDDASSPPRMGTERRLA